MRCYHDFQYDYFMTTQPPMLKKETLNGSFNKRIPKIYETNITVCMTTEHYLKSGPLPLENINWMRFFVLFA